MAGELFEMPRVGESGERSLPNGPDLFRLPLQLLLLSKKALDEGMKDDHEEDKQDAGQEPQVHHLDI